MTNSPLRWAGSKRSLLPLIRSARPAAWNRYIEPFMGSACVFFDLTPQHASLSDFNSDLVDFFKTLRDEPKGLSNAVRTFDALGADFYDVRTAYASTPASTERSAQFLYLNRFAFNGVYRTNKKGQFNVPRGTNTGSLPTMTDLLAASNLLMGAQVEHRDYLEATAEAVKGDFVYLDPPYRNSDRKTYGEYGYDSFGSELDVKKLASELQRLDALGASVMLSFNDDAELGDALEGWLVNRIERRRNVSGRPSFRTSLKGEILAMNYRALSPHD